MVMVVPRQRLIQGKMLLHYRSAQCVGSFNDVKALIRLAVVRISDNHIREGVFQ